MEATEEQIEQVKKNPPSWLEVMADGRFIHGRVRASKKKAHIAHVIIDLNGEREVLEFTWSAIARAHFHKEVLLA